MMKAFKMKMWRFTVIHHNNDAARITTQCVAVRIVIDNVCTVLTVCTDNIIFAAIISAECKEERRQEHKILLRRIHGTMAQGGNAPPLQPIQQNYPLLPQMPFDELKALQQFDRDLAGNGEMRKQFVSMRNQT